MKNYNRRQKSLITFNKPRIWNLLDTILDKIIFIWTQTTKSQDFKKVYGSQGNGE